MRVGQINVLENKELGHRFHITGFPTVKFYKDGKSYTFKGRRSEEEFVRFAKGGYQLHLEDPDVLQPGVWGIIKHVYNGKIFN